MNRLFKAKKESHIVARERSRISGSIKVVQFSSKVWSMEYLAEIVLVDDELLSLIEASSWTIFVTKIYPPC